MHVEVFDPGGKPVRYYSGKVNVVHGAAQFLVPSALNDTPGRWRVRVRDVISGIRTEREVALRTSPR
jgi:hypothetical protein